MPNTFELIASSTVGSGGAASIDFTSIPSTYTDLILKASLRSANAAVGADLILNINGSSANRTFKKLYGSGSAAGSLNGTSNVVSNVVGNNATANTFNNFECYIPNYAGSTNKSFSIDEVDENNATQAFSYLTAGLWSQTTTITQLTLSAESAANFLQYSTAYLYGVRSS
jgi:hypothetical protein